MTRTKKRDFDFLASEIEILSLQTFDEKYGVNTLEKMRPTILLEIVRLIEDHWGKYREERCSRCRSPAPPCWKCRRISDVLDSARRIAIERGLIDPEEKAKPVITRAEEITILRQYNGLLAEIEACEDTSVYTRPWTVREERKLFILPSGSVVGTLDGYYLVHILRSGSVVLANIERRAETCSSVLRTLNQLAEDGVDAVMSSPSIVNKHNRAHLDELANEAIEKVGEVLGRANDVTATLTATEVGDIMTVRDLISDLDDFLVFFRDRDDQFLVLAKFYADESLIDSFKAPCLREILRTMVGELASLRERCETEGKVLRSFKARLDAEVAEVRSRTPAEQLDHLDWIPQVGTSMTGAIEAITKYPKIREHGIRVENAREIAWRSGMLGSIEDIVLPHHEPASHGIEKAGLAVAAVEEMAEELAVWKMAKELYEMAPVLKEARAAVQARKKKS